MQLRELYRGVSITLPGAAPPADTAAAVGRFITVEERCGDTVAPVAATSLAELTYTVVETLKWRRTPLVRLRQADGEAFWVESDALARNALCFNMHEQPERFAHSASVPHASLDAPLAPPMLIVDSAEPVQLLVNLGAAPQHDVHRTGDAPPTLLFVTGVAAAGKSAMVERLAAAMPERIVDAMRVATQPLAWCSNVDVVTDAEFDEYVAAAAFVYSVEHSGARWGILREEMQDVTNGTKGAFVAVEEHPVAVAAARAAGVECLAVHVTLPDTDTHDQRLRLSSKLYEEQEARSHRSFDCAPVVTGKARMSDVHSVFVCPCSPQAYAQVERPNQ